VAFLFGRNINNHRRNDEVIAIGWPELDSREEALEGIERDARLEEIARCTPDNAGKRERDQIEDKVWRRQVYGTGTAKDMSAAFQVWRTTNEEEQLLKEVGAYARKKMHADIAEYDFNSEKRHPIGTRDGTGDDVAQDITIKVWRMMRRGEIKKERGAGSFREFIKAICQNQMKSEWRKIKVDRAMFVPLFVEVSDEDGNMEEIENPLINVIGPMDHYFHIPWQIQGLDREILKWFGTFGNYAGVANELGMTEPAVRTRVKRMREMMKPIREEQLRRRLARDIEENYRQTWKTRANIQYCQRIYASIEIPEWDGPEWEKVTA
jgi:hypothetical protein